MNKWIDLIKLILSIFLVFTPIIILLCFNSSTELLISNGYELGVDGIVVSKNLIRIATLFFISKLGYKIFESINKK